METEKSKDKNFAYIDGANLYKGVSDLGWKLDYRRFRVWLREKYSVEQAYIFIGLVPKYKDLYTYLQESGFMLVFKETIYDGGGRPKGNCDADLVLRATQGAYENDFEKAVIIASDGDYASLVKFLKEKDKLLVVLSPNIKGKCSILLKRTGAKIVYINDKKSILEAK
ncbi:MAG: NYN domain-containing protein [Candidatus Portnoybacteria bacterium]|nr:NYN domain-containing protein [Candidatus Portnoybacteria bacterium]